MDKSFEENYTEICGLIERKRSKWQFKASVMRDFDDVKMEILAHIWKQWALYDQARPLGAWVNTVIHHKITNILRDSYLSTSSPCSRCACNMGDNLCSLYGEQGISCDLYKDWYETKKSRHDARLPLPLENHTNEVYDKPDSNIDIEKAMLVLHKKMKNHLTSSEWDIYENIYVLNFSKEETAKKLGFKTSEKNRTSGYKRFKQVSKKAYIIARQIIREEGLDALL